MTAQVALSTFFQAAQASPLTTQNGQMHPVWHNYFQQLNDHLAATLSPEGLQTPPQNTTNIGVLNNSKSNGKLVYNSDTDTLLVNLAGTFKTIQTL